MRAECQFPAFRGSQITWYCFMKFYTVCINTYLPLNMTFHHKSWHLYLLNDITVAHSISPLCFTALIFNIAQKKKKNFTCHKTSLLYPRSSRKPWQQLVPAGPSCKLSTHCSSPCYMPAAKGIDAFPTCVAVNPLAHSVRAVTTQTIHPSMYTCTLTSCFSSFS